MSSHVCHLQQCYAVTSTLCARSMVISQRMFPLEPSEEELSFSLESEVTPILLALLSQERSLFC